MGSFWNILLTTILIFYAFSLIIKWAFKRKMKKLQQQMEQFQEDSSDAPSAVSKNPHVDPNIGEYTEFEEVE